MTTPTRWPDATLSFARTDHPGLLRDAPNTWNFSPTYDKKHLSVRLGLTYNAANIFSYQLGDGSGSFDPTSGSGGGYRAPNGDRYLYAHLQVDMQGTTGCRRGSAS